MKRSPINRKSPLKATGRRKARSKEMKAHMSKVADLGCIACRVLGYLTAPELHHPRTNAGVGQKASDSDVIPLCPAHHRGTEHPRVPSIHLDRIKFIEQFGTEDELLDMVRKGITA